NWHVIETDGHDMEQLLQAFAEAASVKEKPSLILARTVKGKGVPFMENNPEWHDRKVTEDLYEEAMQALA
nr:transketolase [bacterium]